MHTTTTTTDDVFEDRPGYITTTDSVSRYNRTTPGLEPRYEKTEPLPIPGALSALSLDGRIGPIDGIRGIACLSVVIGHYFIQFYPNALGKLSPLLLTICNKFGWGVDLFFIISGFLIGGILLDHRHSPNLKKAFYLRRIVRIWPLYYLLVFAVIGVRYLYFPPGNHFVPFWSYLLFLQTFWTSGGYVHFFVAGVLWSIAIEEQFYLIAPFVLKRCTPTRTFATITGIILLSILCRLLMQKGWIHFDFGSFLSRLDTIAIGILGAFLIRCRQVRALLDHPRAKHCTLPLIATVGALAAIELGPDTAWLVSWLLPDAIALCFVTLVLLVTLHPQCLLARILRCRLLTLPGIGCYFIYLFHVPVLANFEFVVKEGYLPNGVAIRLIAMAAVLAAAAFSWKFVESPLNAWSRKKWHY